MSIDTPKTDVQRALRLEDIIRSRTANALIKRIYEAILNGVIKQPFTAHDIEDWMDKYNIRKGDGSEYRRGYASGLLSQSYIGKRNTTNGNRTCLNRQKNEKGLYEYWFV